MAVKFTEDQKSAIKAKGTVLVSAAAGSGKTAVLTERVVTALCDPNGVSADRLLIVTFTNASALEMRVRISKRLEEMHSADPENDRILTQKLLLEGAKICTIDAFCIDLVRKYFAVLGINPDFQIADSATEKTLSNRVLKNVLADVYKNPSPALRDLTTLFSLEKSENSFTDVILKLYEIIMHTPQPEKWLREAAECYNSKSMEDCRFKKIMLTDVSNEIGALADRVEVLLNETSATPIEKQVIEPLSGLIEYLESVKENALNDCWNETSKLLKTYKDTHIQLTYTDDFQLLAEKIIKTIDNVNSEITSLDEKMNIEKEVLKELNESYTVVKLLCNIAENYKNELFDEFSNENCYSFSVIEQLALKVLCKEENGQLVPSGLSREICRNYDMVMVDEYQDDNDLQDALFFAISDNGKNLFTVGDVKQCIYGFRGANPGNFLRHKTEYPLYDGKNSPSKIILKENFRSRNGVCDFVNAFCKAIMTKDSCGMDYLKEDELVASAEYNSFEEPDVKLVITDTENYSVKREAADAEAVADYIEEMLAKPPFLKVKDGGLRRAEYRDFAILLRSPRRRILYYVDQLKKRGIPVNYETGSFADAIEVNTVISLLQAIDNPAIDISLLAAMCSVVLGFTPDELAHIKSKYRKDKLYENVLLAADDGDNHCKELLDTLSRYRKAAATLTVGKLIDEIYLDTSLLEIMSAMPHGEVKKNNLLKLSTLAGDYGPENGGIKGFLAAFEHMTGDSLDKTLPNGINAVKIMSFHGSKGLQFPICIIADCGGKFNIQDNIGSAVIDYDYGIGLKSINPANSALIDSFAKQSVVSSVKKRNMAENIRLLYVAMTRAEEKLAVFFTSSNAKKDIAEAVDALNMTAVDSMTVSAGEVLKAKGFSKWILMTALLQADGENLAKHAGLEFKGNGSAKFSLSIKEYAPNDFSAPELEKGTENPVFSADELKQADEIKRQLAERFSSEYKYKNECSVPSKIAVTELVHGDVDKYSFTARPEFMSKKGLTPAERGTATHRFLQYANYENAKEDIVSELNRLKEWEYLSEEEADALDLSKLSKFFESSLFDRIKCSKNVRREYKFMVEYPYQNNTTIVQGIADCIFEEDDGVVILDFKTDMVKCADDLKNAYSKQLKIYKTAIEQIVEKPVKECIIYSTYLSEEIKI